MKPMHEPVEHHPELPLHTYEPTGDGTCAACERAGSSVVRGAWRDGYFDPSFVLSDDERIANLQRLSDAATPGPWIRPWASLEVHYMGGNDGLTAQRDIDFAVAACAFVRDMLEEMEERAEFRIDHVPGPAVELVTPEENAR